MANFGAIVGCDNRGNRDKKSFYRLSAVISREGEQTMELSKKRCDIKPSNLQYTRDCSAHFISGELYLKCRCAQL